MQPEYTSHLTSDKFSLQYQVVVLSFCSPGQRIQHKKHCIYNNTRHNIYEAAGISKNTDNTYATEIYYINGICHNDNKPAILKYRPVGKLWRMTYYINGRLQNDYGPAHVIFRPDGTFAETEYYTNNILHNAHGPAVTQYHSNGKIARINYLINGDYHNTNGSAATTYNSNGNIISEYSYTDGKLVKISVEQ